MRICLAFALICIAYSATADPAKLVVSSRISLENGLRGFGGLSGLLMQNTGQRALILNDQGQLFNLALLRSEDGKLEDFVLQSSRVLNFYGPRNRPDTEGIAEGPDGGIYVSIEDPMTVLSYLPGTYWPDSETPLPRIRRLSRNRGLEALAIDAEGRLVTLPETVPWGRDGFPIFRFESGGWSIVTEVPNRAGFYMVGADFGPDGALYLLERAVSLLGFRARILRIWLDAPGRAPEILFESNVNQFDNLEGLSVWTDAQGQLRVTVVSDDNFLRFQESEMVEFTLTE